MYVLLFTLHSLFSLEGQFLAQWWNHFRTRKHFLIGRAGKGMAVSTYVAVDAYKWVSDCQLYIHMSSSNPYLVPAWASSWLFPCTLFYLVVTSGCPKSRHKESTKTFWFIARIYIWTIRVDDLGFVSNFCYPRLDRWNLGRGRSTRSTLQRGW